VNGDKALRAVHWLPVLSLALIALVAAVPLWGPGIINTRGGGDSPFLLQRVDQMVVNLRAGVFPVRWMPDAAYGLGYPFFNYYSAFPYYLAGSFVLVGLDVLSAVKLVQTFGFLAAGLAMYGWMRRTNRPVWAAWLAGVAYTLAPFHLVNVYVRGDSLSEFYAFVFYPLILWGLDRALSPDSTAMRSRPWRSVVWLWPALAYAGLIISHNISALIFSPFVILYVVILSAKNRQVLWRSLAMGGLIIALGILVTAWAALPALAERGFSQTHLLTGDFFDYEHHFRRWDLVQWRALFGYGIDSSGGTPFAMGLIQAICAAAGSLVLIIRIVRKRRSFYDVFVIAGLLLSTLMITPLAKPLYRFLPLLPMIQFPWRFLSIQSLFAAAATAALVPSDRRGRWCAVGIAVVVLISMLVPLQLERLLIDASEVTTQRLRIYEWFTQNIGTTIRYEWLPQAVVPRPFVSDSTFDANAMPAAIPLDGADIQVRLLDRQPIRQSWDVRGAGGTIAFPLLYWPGWRGYVDNQPVSVEPVQGSGYLSLDVPAGPHVIDLRLERTWVRAVAECLSLVTLLGILAVILINWRQVPWQRVLVGFLVIALPILLLIVTHQETDYADTDLTMDFDRMPYLHHNPGGIDFGGGHLLAGYQISAEEVSPGAAIEVEMDWAAVSDDYAVSLSLVSPAVLREAVRPLIEVTCDFQDSACSALQLRIPADTSRGAYLLQLKITDANDEVRALTPNGEAMGTLYLQPIQVTTGPPVPLEGSVLAPFGPAIRLHSGTLEQITAEEVEITLVWSVEQPVAANYGISLRLLDAAEQIVAARDTQPGYGFLPTSLWHPGELVVDRYSLKLPDGVGTGNGYRLVVILYHVSSGEAIGQARLGSFTLPLESRTRIERPPRVFDFPPFENTIDVDFASLVTLKGYNLAQTDDSLRLTLLWQSLSATDEDYTVFVHLFAPDDESIVTQSDAMPQAGAYPTSWWVPGEVVSETIVLSLEEVPPGSYSLAVGLYDRDFFRLRAGNGANGVLTQDRVVLEETVEITE